MKVILKKIHLDLIKHLQEFIENQKLINGEKFSAKLMFIVFE